MHRLPFAAVALLVSVTLLIGACGGNRTSEVTRSDEGVLRLGSVQAADTVMRAVAPSGRPLVLEGMRGSVRLTGARQSTADLSFVQKGRGDSPSAARSVLEGTSITEKGTDAEYTYTLSAGRNDSHATVDVQGEVPRSVSLRIDRLSGPVHVSGMKGALTVKHEHGPVTIRGATAPVTINIKNGDVHAGFQSVPADGSIRLQTANGDVQLRIPPGDSAQIDAQTDAGTIRTQGLSFTDEQFALVNAGANYEAQVGTNGPTIELRTQNGSIVVGAADTTEMADTTQASPADTATAPAPATVPAPDTIVAPKPDPDAMEADTTNADTMGVDSAAPDTTRF
jgi:hypothetical protein